MGVASDIPRSHSVPADSLMLMGGQNVCVYESMAIVGESAFTHGAFRAHIHAGRQAGRQVPSPAKPPF